MGAMSSNNSSRDDSPTSHASCAPTSPAQTEKYLVGPGGGCEMETIPHESEEMDHFMFQLQQLGCPRV